MKKLKLCLAASLISASLSGFSADTPEITFEKTEVAPGLYMLSGVGGFAGGNIGLSTGVDGVVMIDDSMPYMLDELNKQIAQVAGKPISFLINTHVHGDHTGNNISFSNNGAKIVAHENLRRHLQTKGMQVENGVVKAPEAALPVITFSDAMTFYLNDNEAYVFHVENAHTDGDAVIHFKTHNVVHTGDTLFNGMFPYIDLESGGSVDGYIAAQKKIYENTNDKTKIIPGHGPLASKKDLKASIDMLEDAKKIIGKLVKQGKSEDEVVQLNPLNKYHDKWNWQFITTEKMTRQMYKGLMDKKHHSHGDGKMHSH